MCSVSPASCTIWCRRGTSAFVVAGLFGFSALALAAQTTNGSEPTASVLAVQGSQEAGSRAFASPFLVPGHWSRDALRRLHAHGLLGAGFDASTVSLTRREVALRFEEARVEAERRERFDVAGLATAYQERFAEEFATTVRAMRGEETSPGFRGGSSASLGYEGRGDALLARGLSASGQATPPAPLSDVSEPGGRLDLGLQAPTALPQVAAHASVQREMDDWSVVDSYGILALGEVGFWFGRRAPGFSVGDGGGLVLSGSVPHTGGGLFLTDGARLPSVFRHLGSWRVEGFVARPDQAGRIESPWFVGLRAALAPHRRVRFGINRGMLLGGENNAADANFGRVVKAILGFDIGDEDGDNFENQVASLDLWVAPPLGQVPLALYAEVGVEDISRRVTQMPAVLVGAELASLPELPEVGIGVEVTHFEAPEAGRPWYDHRVFGTWTNEGRLLGHPLGGEGTEWRFYTHVDAARSQLRLRGHAFTRDRGEGNLFAPVRAGDAWGVGGQAEYRVASHVDVIVAGETEVGEADWTQSQAFLGLRVLF